jgi:DNA-binding GntR family transcriptional regulator
MLAAERAQPPDLEPLRAHVETMRAHVGDFAKYRRADVFFHLGLAEAAHSARLLAMMTEVQGQMTDLIAHIAHPAPVLARSNDQHAKLVTLIERGDGLAAARLVREHMMGTEHVLVGLMP